MKAHSVQYTIRGVPENVDKVLREEAKKRQISMNKLIVDELSASVGKKKGENPFMKYVGSIPHDEATETLLWEQRQVDPEDWK